MRTRIITGIFLVFFLMLPSFLFMDTVFLPILCSLLALVGVFEMLRCIGQSKNPWLAAPAYVFAVLSPFAARYADMNSDIFPALAVLLVVSVFYILTMNVLFPDKADCRTTSLSFVLTVYVIIGFCALVFISQQKNALYLFPMVFIGSFITDTFCYFCGMLFGKHKLIPRISPKKTIEGAIGGSVFCVLIFLLYGHLVSIFTGLNADFIALGIAGLALSIISQLGDLIASAVKRTFNVKDYGKLFPGHGGVMDRFDSFIAVASLLAVIITQLNIHFFF